MMRCSSCTGVVRWRTAKNCMEDLWQISRWFCEGFVLFRSRILDLQVNSDVFFFHPSSRDCQWRRPVTYRSSCLVMLTTLWVEPLSHASKRNTPSTSSTCAVCECIYETCNHHNPLSCFPFGTCLFRMSLGVLIQVLAFMWLRTAMNYQHLGQQCMAMCLRNGQRIELLPVFPPWSRFSSVHVSLHHLDFQTHVLCIRTSSETKSAGLEYSSYSNNLMASTWRDMVNQSCYSRTHGNTWLSDRTKNRELPSTLLGMFWDDEIPLKRGTSLVAP